MSCCEHAQLSPNQRIADANAHALERGVSFTPLRSQVLELLANSSKPLGAYDLIAQLSKITQKMVAPITIYRTLDFLTEQGLAHRINAINGYIACSHKHGEGEVIFMVCETCGCVSEENMPELALPRGFKPKKTTIEVFGTCAHCP